MGATSQTQGHKNTQITTKKHRGVIQLFSTIPLLLLQTQYYVLWLLGDDEKKNQLRNETRECEHTA